MSDDPHPAHVHPVLAAIASAPTEDRLAFAAYVKLDARDPFPATLVAALRQAPEFLAEHFPQMPEADRAERLRLCRDWLDWLEAGR